MKKFFGLVLRFICILFLSVLAGYFLLILVHLIPTEKLDQHMQTSLELADSSGAGAATYGDESLRLSLSQGFSPRTLILNNRGFSYDVITDKTMLAHAGRNSSQPPHIAALQSDYARYWHGYLIILKPLLFIMTYRQILIFNAILMLSFYIWILFLIGKKEKTLIVSFLFATMMVAPVTIPFSLQYCAVTYITLISIIIFLKNSDIFLNRFPYLLYYFFMIGAATSYFDFLTFPLMSFGIPMTFVLYYEKSRDQKWQSLIRGGTCWCAGYLSMWAGKWLLATVLLKENIFADAINNIAFRASHKMDFDGSGLTITWYKAIFSNLCNYTNIFFVMTAFIGIAYVLYQKKHHRNNAKIICMDSLLYWILILLPFAWYIAFPNHSYIHGAFTYRSLMVSWFAGMCWLWSL